MHESIIGVRQIDHYCTFDRTKSAVSNIIHCTRKKELEKEKKISKLSLSQKRCNLIFLQILFHFT